MWLEGVLCPFLALQVVLPAFMQFDVPRPLVAELSAQGPHDALHVNAAVELAVNPALEPPHEKHHLGGLEVAELAAYHQRQLPELIVVEFGLDADSSAQVVQLRDEPLRSAAFTIGRVERAQHRCRAEYGPVDVVCHHLLQVGVEHRAERSQVRMGRQQGAGSALQVRPSL